MVLVLVLQFWCCFVKHDLVTIVVTMILKDTTTFQVLCIISLFCDWIIATVEINSGIHLLNSYICEVPLFTSGGLGLGLKNLVLFTSLVITPKPKPKPRRSRVETRTSEQTIFELTQDVLNMRQRPNQSGIFGQNLSVTYFNFQFPPLVCL